MTDSPRPFEWAFDGSKKQAQRSSEPMEKKPNGPQSPSAPIDLSGSLFGEWQITDTVSSTRKNLFSVDRHRGYHVGTIISGSRSQIERFELSLSLIRVAPEMHYILSSVASSLRSGEDVDNSELLSMIDTVLSRVSPPSGDG